MTESEEKQTCSFCECEVNIDDDFCPNCGILFEEDVKCCEHAEIDAAGVCVICCEPFCDECGLFVDDRTFLCNEHSEYQILEGMVSLFKTNDAAQMEIVRESLTQNGQHPIIFSERMSHKSSHILNFISPKESSPYEFLTNNEQILMAPFQEVIPTEKILRELKLLDEE